MHTSGVQVTDQTKECFTRTWRYKLGLIMIVAGNAAILCALALPFVGVSAGIVGAIVVGGEIVSLASIAFLGKEGFKAIKSKILGVAQAGYTAPVGPVRHYIGIVLLLTHVLTTYLMVLYACDAFDAATVDPAAAVWGLDIAQQGTLVLWLFLVGEISFLISIYVLGADWWGRFRSIFVWQRPEG